MDSEKRTPSEMASDSGPAPVGDAAIAALEPFFADLENRLDALIDARFAAVETRRQEAQRQTQLARFAADNPDFQELAANGALDAQKRLNPLLDDVGAYYAHNLATERQSHAEALSRAREQAAGEAEARTVERFRTKKLARTLSAAPSEAGRGQGVDPDLRAPEKFGGINTVLAARLTARRKAAGN